LSFRSAAVIEDSSFKADYYNAYVHYALALGILGRNGDMETALAKSARLSGKPRSYREFEEIRRNITSLSYPHCKE